MPNERFTTMQAEKVAGREVFGELETDMLQDCSTKGDRKQ